jgi:hypothetical protein
MIRIREHLTRSASLEVVQFEIKATMNGSEFQTESLPSLLLLLDSLVKTLTRTKTYAVSL